MKTKTEILSIPTLNEDVLEIQIEGISPLVVNKNHFTVSGDDGVKAGKVDRNPELEFQNSIHWIDQSTGRSGFPARGFKAACVTAGQLLKKKDYQKAKVRGAFFIPDEFVEINGTPKKRHDVVRLNGRTPDNRYRAEYWPWTATIRLSFSSSILSIEQILQLFAESGAKVGIGEDRPEKGGTWGRFKLVSAKRFTGA
jgi:hypothetical protein